jgi:hypothetical protein
MARVIGPKADADRIEVHVRTAYRRAVAAGGAVGKAGQARLAEAVAELDSARVEMQAATNGHGEAAAMLAVEEGRADVAVGKVRDEMWNALGRPRQNAVLDRIFPNGVATYTKADPKLKPLLMQVLGARIQAATSDLFAEPQKDEWVTELETRRKAFQAATETHRPAEATAMLARYGYRGAVRIAVARLRDFKRDLLTLGMSEAAIHDIIPDASRPETTPAPPVTPVQSVVVKAA